MSLVMSMLVSFAAQQSPASRACTHTVSGVVRDAGAGSPLAGAQVLVSEGSRSSSTGSDGQWTIEGLCPGVLVLLASAPEYRQEERTIEVPVRDFIEFRLTFEVETITVTSAPRLVVDALLSSSLEGEALAATRGGSLGEALDGVAGSRVLRSGTVAKPVIDGFVGSRVLVLSDGVRHHSQLWGHDHAPEVDPFGAARLRVVRGASAVRFGADALGGAVLLEPPPLPFGGGLSGEFNLVGQSNGQQGAANLLLGAAFPKDPRFAARLQGSLRKAASLTTPGYALDNTGQQESNLHATLGFLGERLQLSLGLTHYAQRFGVFTGQVSESAGQFQAAIVSGRPRNVELYRTDYAIERPFQAVTHSALRAEATYRLDFGRFRLLYGLQHNDRQEFDLVRRALDGPQLSFALTSQSLELTFEHRHGDHEGVLGLSGLHQENEHSGRRFIPDYQLLGGSLFAIERYRTPTWAVELGARYERQHADTEQQARIAPLKNAPERHGLSFEALMVSLDLEHAIGRSLTIEARAASATRIPTMNELFVDGISQGQGSFELGRRDLAPEKTFNLSAALALEVEGLESHIHGFVHFIHDYIYFAPRLDESGQPETRSTVYGAFPAFEYRNVDAIQAGASAELSLRTQWGLGFRSRASWVRGHNASDDAYLLFVPADRYEQRLFFRREALGPFRQPAVWVESALTLRQSRVDVRADFAPPPEGYHLFNLGVSATVEMDNHPLEVGVEVRNIMNEVYRDYMSRLRYFADEPGFNAILRIRVPFEFDGKHPI